MATSQDIAQTIAEQNQFFMGQYAMATQVGINPMAFGGGQGMGGYGMGGMGGPVMAMPPGAPRAPGAFSYSSGFTGYGAGNRAGALTMGAAGAMMPLGVTAAEILSMTRAPGLAPFVNPVSAFGMARGMGMGMAGSTAVAGGMMLPMMAGYHAMNNIVAGAGQQSMINTALSQYNFQNPQSRTGFGFTRDDAAGIGQNIRQLAMVPELMTSMQELTRLLPTLRSSGLMQGVHDASEFASRFKEAVGTIRDVSKIIGSTMDEAGQFFAHSRRVGFLGRGEQLRNAVASQVVSATTGMSTQEVMQYQQGFADFGTAIGASRRVMTRAGNNMMTQLGLAQQSGAIQQGLVEDLTGKQGGAAVGDAAMRLANLTTRIAGSNMGRFMVAGAMEIGPDGRARINERLLQSSSFEDLQRRGMRMMADPRNAIAFTARQSHLAAEFTAAGGLQATQGLMERLVGQYGDQAPELLMQRYGATEDEAELARQLYRAGTGGEGRAQSMVAQIRQRQASLRENADPRAILRRLSTRVGNAITQPFQRFGAQLWTSITKGVDNFIDEVVGNFAISASEESQQKFLRAFSSANKSDWAALFGNTPATPTGRGGFSDTGISAFFQSMASPSTTGRSQRNAFDTYGRMMGMQGLDINNQGDVDKLNTALSGADRALAGGFSASEQKAVNWVQGLARQEALKLGADASITPQAMFEKVRGAIQSEMSQGAGYEHRAALESIAKRTGGDLFTAGALASQAGKANPAFRASDLGVGSSFVDVKGLDKRFRDAESKLGEAFGQASAADLKKFSKVRDVVATYLSSPDSQNALVDAVLEGDRDAVAKLTGGKRLSTEEMAAAKRALIEVQRNPSYAKTALTDWQHASSAKDLGAFKAAFLDQQSAVADAVGRAKEMNNTKLADALSDVEAKLKDTAQSIGKGDVAVKAKADLDRSLSAAADVIMSAPEKEREKLLAAAPEIVQAAVAGRKGARDVLKRFREGATLSKDEMEKIRTGLHLSEEEMADVFKGSRTLTKAAREELVGVTERHRTAQVFGGAAERQQEKDQQMLTTLKVIAEAVIAGNKDLDAKSKEQLRAAMGGGIPLLGKSDPDTGELRHPK